MNHIIGVDPGLSGAITVLRDGEVLQVYDMPIIASLHGKGNTIDLEELSDRFRLYLVHQPITVFIEAVHSMPNQGVASSFKFGRMSMAPEAISVALGYTVRLVTPQSWKKHFGLIGREKSASRAKAQVEFSNNKDYFKRSKDDGRADSALIALYGYQTFTR